MYFLGAVYLAIFVAVFHIVFYHKYHFPNYVKRINKIPGPKGIFYFGNVLRFYKQKSEDILQQGIRDFQTWGPTMKYWFSGIAIVLVSDVDDVQTILTNTCDQEKGTIYEYLKPWLGTGLLTSAGEKWKMMRKIITPTFHFSILQKYVDVFTKNSKIMMNLISLHKEKDICRLSDFFTYCALDSICETSMGKNIHSQITRKEDEYVSAIFRVGQILVRRLFLPFLYSEHMFMLSSLGRENSRVINVLHKVTSKLIQDRKELVLTNSKKLEEEYEQKKIPFLDLLIEKQKTYNFSDTSLREEVDTVLMAGYDTTSTALTWCFFELGHNEDIQDKVYEELQNIFEDSDREPAYKDLMKMEYLKRVFLETLRLYPSAPVISRKFSEDIQLKNYTVPANTDIVLVLYYIHRNPKIFPNPEVFDPDRFLPAAMRSRNPFAYIPFSAGPRNCLGQKYAMLQMLATASYLLRKYKIETMTSRKLVKPVPDMILRPNVEITWKITPR